MIKTLLWMGDDRHFVLQFSSLFSVGMYIYCFAGLGMARGVRTCNTGKREPDSSIGGYVRNGHFLI